MAKKHDDEDRVIIRFDNEEGEEEEAPFNLFDDEDETSQSKDPNRYADDSEEITAAGEKPVDEAEQMRLRFSIPCEQFDRLNAQVVDASFGKCSCRKTGEAYAPIDG